MSDKEKLTEQQIERLKNDLLKLEIEALRAMLGHPVKKKKTADKARRTNDES